MLAAGFVSCGNPNNGKPGDNSGGGNNNLRPAKYTWKGDNLGTMNTFSNYMFTMSLYEDGTWELNGYCNGGPAFGWEGTYGKGTWEETDTGLATITTQEINGNKLDPYKTEENVPFSEDRIEFTLFDQTQQTMILTKDGIGSSIMNN